MMKMQLPPDIREKLRTFDEEVLIEAGKLKVRREAQRLLDGMDWVKPPVVLRGGEFLAIQHLEEKWIYQALIQESDRLIVAAQFKTGKSTLLGNMLKADCDGGFLFNCYKTLRLDSGSRALYLNLELPDRKMQEYIRGLSIQHQDAFSVVNALGWHFDILNDNWYEWLGNVLVDENISRLYVDPLRNFHSAKSNDDDSVKEVTGRLDRLRLSTPLRNIVIASHTPKPGRDDDPWDFQAALGSQGWSAWADVLWSLTRDRDNQRYLATRGRNGETAPMTLNMDSGGHLSISIESPTENKASVMKHLVLEHLQENGESTKTDLKSKIRGNDTTILNAIKDLIDEGTAGIKRVGRADVVYLS